MAPLIHVRGPRQGRGGSGKSWVQGPLLIAACVSTFAACNPAMPAASRATVPITPTMAASATLAATLVPDESAPSPASGPPSALPSHGKPDGNEPLIVVPSGLDPDVQITCIYAAKNEASCRDLGDTDTTEFADVTRELETVTIEFVDLVGDCRTFRVRLTYADAGPSFDTLTEGCLFIYQ